MKTIIFILFGFVYSTSFAQPFAIGKTTITFFDSTRNRDIPTEIYYPALTAGTNTAIATSNSGVFPSLVFGHGFVMTVDAYQNFWEALVPQGYIMAFPKTEGSLSPSHTNFAKDLAFVIEQMNLQNLDENSIFYSKVSVKNAVMGHSMGGGSAILSVQYSTEINHIATFAAAETNPSAIAASQNNTIPSMFFAATNDCVTPPNANQLPMYEASTTDCKKFISIQGGSHCQMANSNFFCNVGEVSCSPSPTISRANQHEVIFTYLSLWLDYYLNENCPSGSQFESLVENDEENIFESNCVLCNPLNTISIQNEDLKIYPNPFDNFIQFENIKNQELLIQLVSISGKIIWETTSFNSIKKETNFLESGVYFLKVTNQNIVETFKLIKK